MNRVVIYGWFIPVDNYKGSGSGTLVDLTYLVDDDVDISEVLSTIQHYGKFIVKRNAFTRAPEADRVDVQNITVGIQREDR